MGEVFLQLWWGEAKSTDWTTVEAGYSGTCIVICIIIWDVEEIMQNVDKDKVNRCLARYSPRAKTTNRPTKRALNKPAWPGPN